MSEVPNREVQLLAALLQIALQGVIIITGNYTFFNILTIVLALALVPQNALPEPVRPRSPEKTPARTLFEAPSALFRTEDQPPRAQSAGSAAASVQGLVLLPPHR